jgi:hypothetical protein
MIDNSNTTTTTTTTDNVLIIMMMKVWNFTLALLYESVMSEDTKIYYISLIIMIKNYLRKEKNICLFI